MKTFKRLYPQVCAFDNLVLAARNARRHKRYKRATLEFDRRLEENLWELHQELTAKTYRPGTPHQFIIHEPKERVITAAPYRDRVVHHAICNIIDPIFEARFIHDSFACRVGKGTHSAVDKCQKLLRHHRFVLRGDVQKYFPSIDHEVLKRLLGRRIADKDMLWLLGLIIDRHKVTDTPLQYHAGDDLFTPLERSHGIPIGNLTSQLWANLVLHELDQFVKCELHVKDYLRYMDDFLLFSDSKSELWSMREQILNFLDAMRLTLHPRKSDVLAARNGIPFLGFHIYPERRRVLRVNVRTFLKRYHQWQEQYSNHQISLQDIAPRLQGWIGHVSHADSWRLRSAILLKTVFTKGQIEKRLQPC
jgi:retron-type reverse transcriptase